MARLTNPFDFEPATGENFVGREDTLNRWRERLTKDSESWKTGKSWMVVGPGGIGKTSLLRKMEQVAREEFQARVIWLDLGFYRELDSPADLFHELNSQLPPARTISSLLRKAFSLPPDATASQLGIRAGRALFSKVAISVADDNLGAELGGPDAPTARPSGIGARLTQLFNSLAVLAEEQPGPVVLLLDQLGKAHDSDRWRFVAEQFLRFVEEVRREPVRNLFLVIGVRPERKGWLEYRIARGLFSDFNYDFKDVHPLSETEAVEAVLARDRQMELGLARRIVRAVRSRAGDVDPYALQLAAMAVWDYVYEQGYVGLRDDEELLLEIIAGGHERLLRRVREQPAQWSLLRLLAIHESGLTLEEAVSRLPPEDRVHQSRLLDTDVVSELMSDSRLRLLSVVPNRSPSRYAIAHDLLREFILHQIPSEEQQTAQLSKLLADSSWRYRMSDGRSGLLSDAELDSIWHYSQQIGIADDDWEVIVASELELPGERILSWLEAFPERVAPYLTQGMCNPNSNVLTAARRALLSVIYLPEQTSPVQALELIALESMDAAARIRAAEMLAKLGGSEAALTALVQLSRSDENDSRLSAAITMANIGHSHLAANYLSTLIHIADSRDVRLAAFNQLADLGEVAVSNLAELVGGDNDDLVRVEAAKRLDKAGHSQLAYDVLFDLARSAVGHNVRLDALDGLATLSDRKLAIDSLLEMALHSDAYVVRETAAEKLAAIGGAATSALVDLIGASNHIRVRLSAAYGLAKLGQMDFALPILRQLTRSAETRVRLSAATKLVSLGRVDLALPILDELYQITRDTDAEHDFIAVCDVMAGLGSVNTVIESLSELMTSTGSENSKLGAAGVLARLGRTDVAVRTLFELSYSSTEGIVRWQATRQLAELGEVAISELYSIAFHHNDKILRGIAVEALASVGEGAASVLFGLALNAEDESVRLIAAEGLARVGDTSLAYLNKLAHSADDESVRLSATIALITLGEPEVLNLEQLVRDSHNRDLQRTAIEIASRFPEAQRMLIRLALDSPLEASGAYATLTLLTPHIGANP